MSGTLRKLLAPGTKAPWWFTAGVVLVLAGAAWWYVALAIRHGNEVNQKVDHQLLSERNDTFDGDAEAQRAAKRPLRAYDLNDQRVYMNYAKLLREHGLATFTTRMRMPMYMWLLSLATDATPREPTEEGFDAFLTSFFPTARAFNVGLSLVALVALFFALRGWLGNWLGVAFCLVAAFQLFVLKSPYVQPEVLLTTLVTVGVAWIVKTLHEPTWRNALVTGLVLCAWHLTKANALVAVGLMGMVMGLQLLCARDWPRRRAVVVAGLVTLAAYLVPMSPYLYTSWKVFGDPFHNVQSKYYMWAESTQQKHDLQTMDLDRDLTTVDKDGDRKIDNPDALPSARNYWKNHSLEHIQKRLVRGVSMMFTYSFDMYTAIHWLQMLWLGILLWAVARRWREAVFGFWSWRWSLLFIACFLTLVVYLFGWFTPLKVGPRLVNSISLLPLFFCMAATAGLLRRDSFTVGGVAISTTKALTLVFLAFWLVLTALQLPPDLRDGYFAG